VEIECISHNFSLFAIFVLKIIKIGGNLTKFWQKQFCTVFFETRCITRSAHRCTWNVYFASHSKHGLPYISVYLWYR